MRILTSLGKPHESRCKECTYSSNELPHLHNDVCMLNALAGLSSIIFLFPMILTLNTGYV